MSIDNLQQNLLNRQYTIYNFTMQIFDADVFADWLTDAYERSRFKSFAALADEAKLSRSTVSALAGAKKQPLTDKPSQPKPETVISLAKALNEDVNNALNLAGHASLNGGHKRVTNAQEFLDVLAVYGLPIPNFANGLKSLENVGADELNEALEAMIFRLVQQARKTDKNNVIEFSR